jgi:hypothetical protein
VNESPDHGTVQPPGARGGTTADVTVRPGRRKLLIVGVPAMVMVVVGITVWLLHDTDTGSDDRQQVAAAIRHYYAVERDQGVSVASASACKEIRDSGAALPQDSGGKQDIAVDKIANIAIQGDTATAEVTARVVIKGQPEAGSDTVALRLQREQGTWRFCTFSE